MQNVGIVTWHYYPNFGSALQAYALQMYLQNMGMRVKIINYRQKKFGIYSHSVLWKMRVKYMLRNVLRGDNPLSIKMNEPFVFFQKEFLKETPIEQNEEKLKFLCKDMDTVICGSDQIWAPSVFNPIYMLDFVPDNIKKVSYAASIGLNDIDENLCDKYTSLLNRFSEISVREEAGAELLSEKCGIRAEVVLDPTLLVEREHWEKLEKIREQVDGEYIFCYFLNAEHEYKKTVMEYAKKHRLCIVGYSANKNDLDWIKSTKYEMGPREFLWLVHNARAVFTDSYHGTIFSLLFHKDFITFERFKNTDANCQNSRIYQLDKNFDLSERIINVSNTESLEIADFDYNKFEEKLLILRKKSRKFLEKVLEV